MAQVCVKGTHNVMQLIFIGCANCVWIKYADDVNEYFTKKEHNSKAHKILDKYKAIKEEMEKHVEDDNLRAYLLMEIKLKFKKK